MIHQQAEYHENNTNTTDPNQSFYDSGRQSQMATPLSSRPITTTRTNNFIHVPDMQQQSLNRDTTEQFSRLWVPTATVATASTTPPARNIGLFTDNATANAHNRNDTISNLNNNLISNFRNNNLNFTRSNPINGPTTPLSIEVEPWELSSGELEAEMPISNRYIRE